MCVSLIGSPTVSPGSLVLPGSVTVTVVLQSAKPTTVTMTCSVSAALGSQSWTRTEQVQGSAAISQTLQLNPADGAGKGAHVVTVRIDEPGCPPINRAAGVTGL